MSGPKLALATLARLIVFATYAAVAMFEIFTFAGGGHGSYKPAAILFAWGVVPWQLELVSGWLGLFGVPLAYLVVLFLGARCLVRRHGLVAYAAVAVMHFAGALAGLALCRGEHLPRGFPITEAWALPTVVAVLFFGVDFLVLWLARPTQGESQPRAA